LPLTTGWEPPNLSSMSIGSIAASCPSFVAMCMGMCMNLRVEVHEG
jgi:hypothetical protein